MAQPGVQVRSVITVGMVVAMIFCIVLLVAIAAAHLYGVFFLKPPDPNTHGRQGAAGGTALLAAAAGLGHRCRRRGAGARPSPP